MIDHDKLLVGKRVLFIGQVFYDYHSKISDELERRGAEVDFFENKFFPEDESISEPGLARSVRKLFLPNRKSKYNEQIIAEIGEKKYDYLFSIGGFGISPELLIHVKKVNEKVISIIYFWDSFSVWNYAGLLPLFDRAYSFDPIDCEKWDNLKYLPLFYTSEYVKNEQSNVKKDIDLLYIGSVGIASVNRCDILTALDRYSKEHHYQAFLWLYFSPNDDTRLKRVVNIMKRLLLPSYKKFITRIAQCKAEGNFITNKVLGRTEVADLMNRSKCVVDIPVPGQAGLTIRTIETLAQGKKIVTTNKQIIKEAFYDPAYIAVIDRSFEEIDRSFIEAEPSHKLDVTSLHITNWIKNIFS